MIILVSFLVALIALLLCLCYRRRNADTQAEDEQHPIKIIQGKNQDNENQKPAQKLEIGVINKSSADANCLDD